MANLFVRSRPTTNWAANTAYVLGDRRKATAAKLGIHFECTTAGTSHATTEPTWTTTVGGTTSDGTVVWTTRGSANTWAALTAYVLGDRVVATTSASAAAQNYVYECTTAGTSLASEPSWNTTTPDSSTTTEVAGPVWTLRKCSTWNNAHIKLEKVQGDSSGTGKTAAGDTIYVGDEHTQTQASALSFNQFGTLANPINFICVNDTGDPATPTTLAATASVATTGANAITICSTANRAVYFNGVKFQAGDSTNNAGINLGATRDYVVLENCLLELRGNNASSTIGGALTDTAVVLINTPVKFANASQGIAPSGQYTLEWRNTPSGVQGTAPTTLFPSVSGPGISRVNIHGVDLSGVATNLFDITNTSGQGVYKLYNCKLTSAITVALGTSGGLGTGQVQMVNCDSAATNYRLATAEARGTLVQETTIVKSGGASDGTTPISWKMASGATTPRFSLPLASFPIPQWNNNSGSSKTLTVEIVHDSVTNLTDAEVWVEAEYLGSSATPLSSFANDSAGIVGTPADQAASSVTWTTTGLSNPNKQKLSVSFTPQMKGPVIATVYLAKVSKTIYVDPVATIS